MTYEEAQALDAKEAQEPWYRDSDAPYRGCAMPIGTKAEFWRQYYFTTLHERVQYRSLQDRILRDLADVERQYVELREDYGMRVMWCETWCPGALGFRVWLRRRVQMAAARVVNSLRKSRG